MPQRIILDDLIGLSVKVNGLIVPGRQVEQSLSRHSFNLVVNNDHETYKVSLVGSATAIKFKGRFLLICTNHQLVGVDSQHVAMLKDDGSILVTSSGYRAYNVHPDTDAHDFAAFDFSEAVAAHPDLAKRFFDLNVAPPDGPNVDIVAVLLTGFPSKRQVYELEESNHLGLARLNIVCLPDGQPSDLAVLRLRATKPLTVDPDGLSGGSAFVIQLVDGEFHAYLAGIILTGGRELFHILKVGYLHNLLTRLYDDESRPANAPKG